MSPTDLPDPAGHDVSAHQPHPCHRGSHRRGPAAAGRPWTPPGTRRPDLLIAATAELAGLAVLHLDEDFDLIADVTGQQVERLSLNE